VAAALAAVVALGGGCSTVGYYAQSVGGHLDLLQRARPIDHWLADPATPAALKERLQVAQQARAISPSPSWPCPTTPATPVMPTWAAARWCGTWWPRRRCR
jgi:hypothetical protein